MLSPSWGGGGPRAYMYVGHLTFQNNFWSNQIKYPEVFKVFENE